MMPFVKPTMVMLSASLLLSGCAATSTMTDKRRGLDPTETNDGGLRQAPPPPEDGESTETDPATY